MTEKPINAISRKLKFRLMRPESTRAASMIEDMSKKLPIIPQKNISKRASKDLSDLDKSFRRYKELSIINSKPKINR